MGTEIEVPPLTLWVKARQDGTVPQHALAQWNVSPNMATLLRRQGNQAAFVLLTGRTQREDGIVLNRRFRRAFEVPTNRRSLRITLKPADDVVILLAVSGLYQKASRERLTYLVKSPIQMGLDWDKRDRTFRLRPLSYEFYPIEEASATLAIQTAS